MQTKINVGVIGAGRIGRLHAETLISCVPQANLVAIADAIADAAASCAEQLGIESHYTDHRLILDNPDIDAVFICSSTDTHADFIQQAAAAGKHIFCEKPIDLDPQKIDTALTAVEQAGVKLQVGFNRRFDPNFKRARDLVAEGRIGAPEIVRITSRDPEPPPIEYVKVSGGLFLDMAIHDFDMCRFLLDEEVKRIFACGTCLVDPAIGQAGDIDTAVTTLTYQSGALCTIDNSRRSVSGYDQRIEIFGSEGCVVVGNPSQNSAVCYSDQQISMDLPYFFFLDRYRESYIAEAQDFIQCLMEDREPSVGGLDGKISVLMGLDAIKSYHENRPVDVSYD
ncbi:MAG: inositol 2-dehydrogenase [Desulfobacteraceae bacterium]|jgi:myo-inositol 2-dehydrogenase/D-chiro-inositol 1-dehydrogenase